MACRNCGKETKPIEYRHPIDGKIFIEEDDFCAWHYLYSLKQYGGGKQCKPSLL
jgi:hypothetical protein